MFRKILVANRGEIAVRIINTLKRLGIKSVAVYSEADKAAGFVQEADESYCIGESQIQKSYTNITSIINVALKANVDAIHPGYGFLSESSEFAIACIKKGLTFIGPPADVIEKTSNKLVTKQLMNKMNVPVLAGSEEFLQDINHAKQVARKLGYPVMLKANTGGGGIGLSVINNEEELERCFHENQQRADMYFGEKDLFLEKYIYHARHIEVQVACDQQGNAIHLFERECSVQRRYQKIVEESPSPSISFDVKNNLIVTALKATMEIGFQNVGTVEFILDEHMNFYFIGMNGRIQVEHTVTEETLGLDLVEMQIHIAAGLNLKYNQSDIKQIGHAVECRLYAEDPVNYVPSPGKIKTLHIPSYEGVRLDIGVQVGDVITPFYDPLLGKIITYGPTREHAIATMCDILKNTQIEGMKTNLPTLQTVIRDGNFTQGNYTTSVLKEEVTIR